MSKTGFRLNRKGVQQLMRSKEMQKILTEKASSATSRLGSGYDHDIYVGRNRANAMVYADSYAARVENMKSNSILKAVR